MYLRLEALFAGLRNIKGYMGRTAGHYKIEICFGELNLKSGISSKSYGKCYNFLDPFAAGYVVRLILSIQFSKIP